ncbi:anthranilate synthase component I family protein [Staphylospora marina]|uniref:anthranilate synthase component I family protein n=1 Tax=Staphylospora marina TaxID=2490858 RepID=UPI0013DE5710|nr:anthranilate synthase component I family protein [Staphylospora marina]
MRAVLSPEEVFRLSRRFSCIPVMIETDAAEETPIRLYARMSRKHGSFLLIKQRFAWIADDPVRCMRSHRGSWFLRDGQGRILPVTDPDPFVWLKKELERNRFPRLSGCPPLAGGMAGWIGFGSVRFLEPNRPVTRHPNEDPDICLMRFDRMSVMDQKRGKLWFTEVLKIPDGIGKSEMFALYGQAVQRLMTWAGELLSRPVRLSEPAFDMEFPVRETDVCGWTEETDPHAFHESVRQVKERIASGDVFQVVLSRSWSRPRMADPLDVLRVLERINPSPYLFLMETEEESLVGASPETLVRVTDGRAEVHPIAGTRPRGSTPAEDERLAAELSGDEKERAEHVMLVDLARNDLGKVAVSGTVRVSSRMKVERYSRVMHLVSRVEAGLKEGHTAVEAFRACFPAGTVSGAPKVKALEWIARLEPSPRGWYAGAGVLFGGNGDMDSWILIRTARFAKEKVTVRTGAGIVADSEPEREAEETENKAAALFRAIRLAEMTAVGEGSP